MSAKDAIERAWTCYRQAKPQLGMVAARSAVEQEPDLGEAWYVLACNCERGGRLMAADRAFARAARAKREPVGAPCRVSWGRFQRSVRLAAAALPKPLQEALAEVTLVQADYAEPYLIEEFDDPELMGLLEGQPRSERAGYGGLISPRIHLWRRSHEHASGSLKEFDAEVRQTLHHELGHYLGLDEGDLERLGMG